MYSFPLAVLHKYLNYSPPHPKGYLRSLFPLLHSCQSLPGRLVVLLQACVRPFSLSDRPIYLTLHLAFSQTPVLRLTTFPVSPAHQLPEAEGG